ncbi:unnamed protein product [Acanthoscelides obtectus]|uniref:Amyloid protein-binding protein 2 n=1 Tax=Acanthoscelides obtectus TaxID=200917 RepID=A0A9P0LAE3_ACAOB|nr:unnamed protein product [Acanthoscelides obtectus]CAK1635968.1 Amyloid protein-binding protein 2 [Acanthoscelides obtectus]
MRHAVLEMYLEKRLCLLAVEFNELDVFIRMLQVKHKRTKLLKSFQALIDHGTNVPEMLIKKYVARCNTVDSSDTNINIGLKLGTFFNESGLFHYSIIVLNITESVCKKQPRDVTTLRRLLDCYHKRIYAEATYCEFKEAAETFNSTVAIIEELKALDALPNLAGLYSNFSYLHFIRSEYEKEYDWSQKALALLTEDLPSRIIIDVLRQASKACVLKRKFNKAGLLIRQAVTLASELYLEDGHPYFADALTDYAFYLLNSDSVQESVKVYDKALSIKKEVFEKNNIHVALGHEDLAYALYVNEYSSGRFYHARENAERSIRIMERILPKDHHLLASVKRVKALILEEIALDEQGNMYLQLQYLEEAEQLHRAALALSQKSFGEDNVQTAKHYGNLGRLYQSMKMYDEAERMHVKAIMIKEELLGKDDYEVGLSTGHLASLYNYHMKRYRDAEKLYLRSLEINLRLFGEAYSGLEYDYRGLVNVYAKLLEHEGVINYSLKMTEWQRLREEPKSPEQNLEPQPLKQILENYFNSME